MNIFVEHHNWIWNKKQGGWSGNVAKVFDSKENFDKYVLNQKKKHPYDDITYFIYESLNGKKGDALAHLNFNGVQFNAININSKWLKFCNQ